MKEGEWFMSKKVAVIGLGPSGCYAARAARDLGCEVDVFTFGETKPAPGAFWLHWLPDELARIHKAENIYLVGKGNPIVYSQRQWGDLWNKIPTNSFPTKDHWTKGWNFSKIFETLLPMQCDVKQMAYPLSDTDIKDLSQQYDKVFQTFPRKQDIEAQPKKIPFVVGLSRMDNVGKNFVVYNGEENIDNPIVREACLFGWNFSEFPKNYPLSKAKEWHGEDFIILKDFAPGTEPIPQDIHDKIQLVGRWAEWNSMRLSHQVYGLVDHILTSEVLA